MDIRIEDIDFSVLMDLRVDFAFKITFGDEDTEELISLLNAIFSNKGIPRIVKTLKIKNPTLERKSRKDKLSILDIRAKLADGSNVSIEMHLYDIFAIKYKTVRSCARIFSEDLKKGKKYTVQKPTICISFVNGPISDYLGRPIDKVHSLFYIMERDSHELLLNESEIHFINMEAFANLFNRKKDTGINNEKLNKWLLLLTEKEINDKGCIKDICSEEEIMSAIGKLSKLSMNKVKRQTYQRRMDNLYYYKLEKQQNAEKATAQNAAHAAALADKDAALADKDAALAAERAASADKDAALADKDVALADKDAALAAKEAAHAVEIAKLRAELEAARNVQSKSNVK